MALAADGLVTLHTRTYPLDAVQDVIADLDAGRLQVGASSCPDGDVVVERRRRALGVPGGAEWPGTGGSQAPPTGRAGRRSDHGVPIAALRRRGCSREGRAVATAILWA